MTLTPTMRADLRALVRAAEERLKELAFNWHTWNGYAPEYRAHLSSEIRRDAAEYERITAAVKWAREEIGK